MSLAQPLLETAHGVPRRPTRSWWVPWLMPSLNRIGIETPSEARSVFWLALQSFLANSVFVLGRNLGPVIFMHQCGEEQLTSVMFVSGASVRAACTPLHPPSNNARVTARTSFGHTT